MRWIVPLLLTVAVTVMAEDSLPAGYWAVDALVVPALAEPQRKDEAPVVRRYYLKDPRVVVVGKRDLLLGDGIIDGQTGGSVAVPLDTVVAMLRFTNNQEFVRNAGRGDPLIGR